MSTKEDTLENTKKVIPVKYSDDENAYRNNLIKQLCLARDYRDRSHPELDGMSYPQYYDDNRRKDLSYIPPKKNKQDIRIVSGTTREKDSTLLSTFLDLNLTSEITAFDQDNMIINELGENMDTLVHKSLEIEDYKKKRPIYYREMIAQGDVFVEELLIEEYKRVPLEDLAWDPTKDGVSEFSFKERLKKLDSKCATRMVNGKKIYLWNIRCEYIEDQPGVAIMNILPREIAEARYSQWERWQNVPEKIDTTEFWSDGSTYKDWNLIPVEDGLQVAEIKIFLPLQNRFMILLNGVMMLPINYPLTAITKAGEIPMAQGKLEVIPDFAYSKSQPSKTKVDQAIIDETQMLFVEAMRQTRKPPMGNTQKKLVGSDVFTAGKITPNLREGQLFPLLPQGSYGIQPSEFSFYRMIKDQIDEKTTNSAYGGSTPQGDPTATEVNRVQNQQVLKLAHQIDGLMNFERRMRWNRIHNILSNWFKPYDTKLNETRDGVINLYKDIAVNTSMESGETGVKLYRLTTDDYPDKGDQEQEEYDLKKKTGKEHRIAYMDPVIMSNLKCVWYIAMTAKPKEDDKLSQMIFVQNITQAMNLFGPESINQEYAKQRYSTVIGENYNKFFKPADILQMLQNNMRPDGQQGGQETGSPTARVGISGGAGGLKPMVK